MEKITNSYSCYNRNIENNFPRNKNYFSVWKQFFSDQNINDLIKLNELLISIINESIRYCTIKRRLTNTVEKQIEDGAYNIVINVGYDQTGWTILEILNKFTKGQQGHVLKKIILIEYRIDLSKCKIEVKN